MFSLRSSLGFSSFLFLGSLTLLLSGCGAGVGADQSVQTSVQSSAVSGQLNGGQNPISGATISVYEMGTGGYGSTASLKASTTTSATGIFSFPNGAYTCSQSNAPTYILSVGGDTGSGVANPNAVLGALLGPCGNAKNQYLVLNEVTTVALAYALSHYFTTTYGGVAPANDSFGGPTTTSGGVTVYSKGLLLNANYMANLIATISGGLATPSSGSFVAEDKKTNTLANILAACVNSSGLTSSTDTTSSCGKLFSYVAYTPPAGGTTQTPTDTLQAAVLLALHPVLSSTLDTKLYNLPGSKVAFDYQLSAAPADWSLSASFTASGLGLGVDTNTLSTIDIDSSNRVWFPTTASGNTGIAYFDPTTQTFSSAINTTGMVHPNQIAIDNSGYAWVSDTQGTGLHAYDTNSIGTATSFTIANTRSYSVSVAPDSSIRTSLYDTSLSKYRLGTLASLSGTYAELTTPALLSGYIPNSMAFDNAGNLEFTQFLSTTPRFYHSLLTSGGTYTSNLDTAADLNGQNFWTGTYLGGVRTWNNGSGSGDGICVTTSGAGTCYSVKSPNYSIYTGASGAAVDGAKTVWVANSLTNSVSQAPLYTSTAYNQTVSSAQQVGTNMYNHNSSNGGTLPAPEGLAVDNGGNVWVANAGCTTTGCTPGSFVLSVLIGAGAPTVTPLAAQIVSGASLAGTQPNY